MMMPFLLKTLKYYRGDFFEKLFSKAGKTAPPNDSIHTAIDVAKLLQEYVKEYTPACKEIERQAKERVDGYFDFLIDELEKTESLAESLGLKNIKASQKNLLGTIDGTMTNALALRFSLDNAECRKILEMAPGESKETAMEKFASQAIVESKEKLCGTISEVLNQLTEELVKFCENYVREQENAADEDRSL